MREPTPLPDDLTGRPFDRRALERAGLSQGRARRRDITRPFHGVQIVRPIGTRLERCRAYRVRMKPGQAFSHQTAALLQDLPLPRTFEDETELHVSAVLPAPAPTTRGVVGHRLRIEPPVVVVHGDLPVVRPDEAWAQLAPLLAVDELIELGDAVLWQDRDALERLRAAASVPYRPNGERLRKALREIRVGAASPGETRIRLLLVRAGLPEPELNAEVRLPSGLVHPDLVWRAQRVAVEYEGAGHGSEQQRRYDIERYELLKEAGWNVVLATADSLREPAASRMVRRLRALTL
jgi:hypothetical protein